MSKKYSLNEGKLRKYTYEAIENQTNVDHTDLKLIKIALAQYDIKCFGSIFIKPRARGSRLYHFIVEVCRFCSQPLWFCRLFRLFVQSLSLDVRKRMPEGRIFRVRVRLSAQCFHQGIVYRQILRLCQSLYE